MLDGLSTVGFRAFIRDIPDSVRKLRHDDIVGDLAQREVGVT